MKTWRIISREKPDPISVQVTLDTEHMAKGPSSSGPFIVDGEAADGSTFSLIMFDKLYTVDADGNLVGASDTEVTVTPVSVIEGLPFSMGFLAAFQLGPEGLLMAEPGKLSLPVPSNVEDEELVGFAANGDGSDFHLFPVVGGSYGEYTGTTDFYFNVMHFSLYGVAVVVQVLDTPLKSALGNYVIIESLFLRIWGYLRCAPPSLLLWGKVAKAGRGQARSVFISLRH